MNELNTGRCQNVSPLNKFEIVCELVFVGHTQVNSKLDLFVL